MKKATKNMDTTNPPCICCKHPVHIEGTELCYYCLFRSVWGTAKYLLFKAIFDNGNTPVTINEAMDLVNKLRKDVGLASVGYDGVQKIFRRYSEFYEQRKKAGTGYLLLVGKRVVPGVKKPYKTFKLSANLVKRLQTYERRWKAGFTINTKNKTGKKYVPLDLDNQRRARSIMLRMLKGEIGFYDFMLVNQKVTPLLSSTLDLPTETSIS